MKISTDTWGEFFVSDLFKIKPTKRYKDKGRDLSNKDLIDGSGTTPVVVNSSVNNGYGGVTPYKPTEQGNMITYSDTVDANTIFYQPKPFVGYAHVQGLHPIGKYENRWNKYSYLFFVTAFRTEALRQNFDYKNKFNRKIAEKLAVKLPVDSAGQPDWKYMEEYMKSKEAEARTNLKRLKLARNYQSNPIDISQWQEFTVGELFEKKTVKGFTKSHYKNELKWPEDNGYYIYGQNIKRVSDYRVLLPDKYLFKLHSQPIIGYASSTGQIGVITEDFYRSGNNDAFQALIPKRPMSLKIVQYVYTCLQKSFRQFNYGTSVIEIPKLGFKLPVKNGQPDWRYMETYMKQIEQRALQTINSLSQR